MSDKGKTYSFKMHDLVWAKMPSYCHWPARIVEPNTPAIAKLRKSPTQHCIFFFGSNNYAWLDEKCLKPYMEFRDEFKAKGKPKDQFLLAMNDIESFIDNPDNFSALFEPKTPIQKKKGTPKAKPQKQDIEADFDSLKSDSSVPSSPSISKTNLTTPKQRVSIEKSKLSEKVPQPKRSSTRESDDLKKDEFEEEMDVEPTASPTPAKKPRKSSQAPGSSPKPRNDSFEPRRRSDIAEASKIKSPKHAEPSGTVYGFIGLGIMGSSILQTLTEQGFEFVIYNRTQSKCEAFTGCTIVSSPREVFEQAHITFVCVSDSEAVKEVVIEGERGIIAAEGNAFEKGLVMMSSIDCETSRDIQSAMLMKGSVRYLEAQIQRSNADAKDNKRLILITAGDKTLFQDCKGCFDAIASKTFYMGEEYETAVKMNSMLQTIAGVQLAALAESFSLADSLDLQLRDILEIISISNFNSDFIAEKGNVIVEDKYREPSMRVDTMQKDLKMAIEFGDSLDHPLPLVAASKEIFKFSKRMGFGQDDAAAVYYASNFNKYLFDINSQYAENGTM